MTTDIQDSPEEERWRGMAISEIPDPPPIDWIIDGYVARGLITELVGFWKAGKTT